MPDPVISEIKYLGTGTLDFLEVRIPDDYPDPENLRLVIYDRGHNGSTTASPSASDVHEVTNDGLLYSEDVDSDGNDDDGILHYTFGTSENGTNIFLHAQDAVGLYNVVTGDTYGLYNWGGSPYTVSTNSGDPFAGQVAEQLDATGQVSGVTSLERQPNGDYDLATTPDPGDSYICFTADTQILTDGGPRAVQHLRVGDQVITKDQGTQKIRWIGQRRFQNLGPLHGAVQPITIKAHTFGTGVPSRATRLSPNHAVLNNHWKAALYFAESEVLTAAKSLLASECAVQTAVSEVTYYHILLDQHALVLANGMWSETLFLGSQCVDMLSAQSRFEVFDMFPHLGGELAGYGDRARMQIKVKEAGLLV